MIRTPGVGAMRRALSLATASGAIVLVLAGCAPAAVDPAAADAWLAAVQDERADAPDLIGATGGQATSVDAARTAGEGITLTLGEPQAVGAVAARCFGGHTATISVEVATTHGATVAETEIACDEQPQRIEVAETAPAVSITVDARAEPATRYYAEILP